MTAAPPTIEELGRRLGVRFFDYQLDAFADMLAQEAPSQRLCLYFRTGAGKSITALAAVALAGWNEALVIAPPVTRPAWEHLGQRIGVKVEVISHATFRMPGYLAKRGVAVIADEFHMFGGHDKKGWKKLDRLARGLKAPMILMSATPNYNDAERCYCIEHILAPHRVKGGFLEFLYSRCTTQQNPFGLTPLVTGFQQFPDAEHYLASLPHVHHVPDNVSAQIVDLPIPAVEIEEFVRYGLSRRKGRIMASLMEARHTRTYDQLIEDDRLRPEVMAVLDQVAGEATTPILVFCNSSTIAKVVFDSVFDSGAEPALVTGETTARNKARLLDMFRAGYVDVLIGTATLATGTDGLDKVCDTLVIVNDTDDDALRRQLIGRILPRGEDVDASGKHIYRLVARA